MLFMMVRYQNPGLNPKVTYDSPSYTIFHKQKYLIFKETNKFCFYFI